MLRLRPYQEAASAAIVSSIKQGVNPCLQMPTGSGKSEVFFDVCRKMLDYKPSSNICILLNRVILLDQTVARLEKVFPKNMLGSVCGTRGHRTYAPVTVATVESIDKTRNFDLVICDEARYVNTNQGSSYDKFLSHQKMILAVDATPWKYDGYIYGPNKMWPKLTYTKPITELIEEGYLVKPIIRKTSEEFNLDGIKIQLGDYDTSSLNKRVEDETKIDKQVTEVLNKAYDRKHIVWVCTSIKHAQMVAVSLQNRNEKVSMIHSVMGDKEIINQLDFFKMKLTRHIVSVSMLISGVDIPHIDCLVMARPTKSSSLWVQCVGRSLRPSEGKQDALILDFGRCAENCGPIDAPVIRKGKNNIISASPPMKFCDGCLSYIPAAATECPDCSKPFPRPEPTKNLTSKPSLLDILKTAPSGPTIVDISPMVQIHMHQGKKAKCVKMIFSPTNFLQRKVFDFAFAFDINKKFKRIGIDGVWKLEDAEKYDRSNIDTGIKKIKVDYSQEYPKILEVIR